MLTRFLAAFGMALLLMGECVTGPETRQGRLEIVATDLTGQRIKEIDVELVPAWGGLETITTKSAGARVLYGQYRLAVRARGFSTTWRDVRVYQAEMVVQVELRVGAIGCPPAPAQIGGRITRRDGPIGELWVKAIPVRGIGGGEARVGDRGYFLIAGLDSSDYLVIVLQGETVVHQQVVRTYPVGHDTSALSINLGGSL